MRSPISSSALSPAWALVDPSLVTVGGAAVADQLLTMARAGWSPASSTQVEIDISHEATRRLLGNHRISTLIPTSCVRADQEHEFRTRLATIYGTQMRVESVARHVLTILNDANIQSRVLKGLASAELDYPSRNYRQTGDVDLALRADEFETALALLKRNGYRHHGTVNAPQLLKGETLDAPNGVEVDLHTRLFQRTKRTSDILFLDPGAPLQQLPGTALCPEHRLVHAAGHFVLTPPGMRRMSGLADVTCIRERHHDLDLAKARSFAQALNVEPLVAAALRLESELARRGNDDMAALASWRQPGWLDRNTRLVPERQLALDHFNRFREIPRNQWVSYLPQWLVPDQRLRRKFVASLRRRRDN